MKLYGKSQMPINSIIRILLLLIISGTVNVSCADTQSVLELTVIDAATGGKAIVRIRLRDESGKDYVPDGAVVVPIGADKWFVSEGFTRLKVSPGTINLRAERGTEYHPIMVNITAAPDNTTHHTVKMKRWVNMKELGYVSSENHVHIALDKVAAMAAAEDLNFATILSWWNSPRIKFPKDSQWIQDLKFANVTVPTAVFCGEKEDAWGAVYVIGLRSTVEFEGGSKRSNLEFVKRARRQKALICYQGGWSRQVLIDALAGYVDVVNVCNNNFHRHKFQPRKNYSNLLNIEGFQDYPNTPEGMMQMNTDTYYRLLNCGLKLAAGAGSAIGAKSTPIGYNRAYVRAGENPSMADFLKAWGEGKNFVTNGPMLFLKTSDGNRPGDTIELNDDGKEITFTAEAISQQPLETLEIIMNGQVIPATTNIELSPTKAKISVKLKLKRSAWIVARCTEKDMLLPDEQLEKYRHGSGLFKRDPCRLRFAHTSPIYITVNGRRTKVDKSIKEANKMLDAFRKFAQSQAAEQYLKEILDAIPDRIE
ncbi:MAG: CehA/McbA family metallohydrolase [Planctomycetes bacterium]|nr:CehA/McbA family metallohydrolase [Planctomycetota bacterium]